MGGENNEGKRKDTFANRDVIRRCGGEKNKPLWKAGNGEFFHSVKNPLLSRGVRFIFGLV